MSEPGNLRDKVMRWRSLDNRVLTIASARTINTFGLSLVMSFLGVHIVTQRGYPAFVYGAIALAANLLQSFSNAWAGAISDRVGRLPLIRASLEARAVVIAILGTQVWMQAPVWSLAITIVFSSMLRGCFEPVAYALVSDVVSEKDRTLAFGLQRMGTNLGWAIGPALGGILTIWLPYGVVFYIAAFGLWMAARWTRKIVDPVTPAQSLRMPKQGQFRAFAASLVPTQFAEMWRRPDIMTLLVGSFFAAVLHTQLFSTLAIFLTKELHFEKSQVGLLYTINGISVLVLQLPAIALIQRLGAHRILPLSCLFAGLAFVTFGLWDSWIGAALSIAFVSASEVFVDPSHQTVVASISEPATRGKTFGAVGFSQMLGVACAPLFGGMVFDTLGGFHTLMWSILGSLGLVAGFFFFRFSALRRV